LNGCRLGRTTDRCATVAATWLSHDNHENTRVMLRRSESKQ
jgi:hypothetical protein